MKVNIIKAEIDVNSTIFHYTMIYIHSYIYPTIYAKNTYSLTALWTCKATSTYGTERNEPEGM